MKVDTLLKLRNKARRTGKVFDWEYLKKWQGMMEFQKASEDFYQEYKEIMMDLEDNGFIYVDRIENLGQMIIDLKCFGYMTRLDDSESKLVLYAIGK